MIQADPMKLVLALAAALAPACTAYAQSCAAPDPSIYAPVHRYWSAGDADSWATDTVTPNLQDPTSSPFVHVDTIAYVLRDKAPSTARLFDCYVVATDDHFVQRRDCGTHRKLGVIGSIYTDPGLGVPLYRFLNQAGSDHTVSLSASCADCPAGPWIQELVLGYVPPIQTTPMGWDPGLSSRCVESSDPVCNHSSDFTGCPGHVFNSPEWLVGVQSTGGNGIACPGPDGATLRVNGPGSPLGLDWSPVIGGTVATLTWDYQAHRHPCPGGLATPCTAAGYWLGRQWTWFALADSNRNTQPDVFYPKPDRLRVRAMVKYDVDPGGDSGASGQVMLGIAATWDTTKHAIELVIGGFNDAATATGEVDVISHTWDTPSSEYVRLRGAPFGVTVPIGAAGFTKVTVEWYEILRNLIDRGYLEPPSGGLSAAVTDSFWIGGETYQTRVGGPGQESIKQTIRVQGLAAEEICIP